MKMGILVLCFIVYLYGCLLSLGANSHNYDMPKEEGLSRMILWPAWLIRAIYRGIKVSIIEFRKG